MFAVKNNTVSARLNDSEKENVNNVLKRIQEATGKTFDSYKEAFLYMAETFEKETVNKSKQSENSIVFTPEAHANIRETMHNGGGYDPEQPISLSEIRSTIEEIFPHDPEVVEKEIEKEVERSLSENEFIVELSDDQLQIAKNVQENRMNEMKKQFPEASPESLPVLFKNCFFNEGVLFSFGGGWWTGL